MLIASFRRAATVLKHRTDRSVHYNIQQLKSNFLPLNFEIIRHFGYTIKINVVKIIPLGHIKDLLVTQNVRF